MKRIFGASIRILFIWAFLGVLPCYSAETPEGFAEQLMQAMDDRDRDAYVALIHPASRKFFAENNPEVFEKRIDHVIATKPPSQYDSYEIFITDIEQEKLYNKEMNAIRVMSRMAIFPVVPSKILTIRVTEKKETEESEFPRVIQALSQLNGEWYMLWPTEYVAYVPPDESQAN